MADAPPMYWQWDGDALIPRKPKLADKYLVVGHTYRMAEFNERSPNSHNHFFAALHNAWMNLPESMSEQFPTSEHLRKYALIQCGFCDVRCHVAKGTDEALRVSSFVKPLNEFAVTLTSGNVVTVYTAKSQSLRAMGGAEFQRSKTAVLDYVAVLIDISREQLKEATQ